MHHRADLLSAAARSRGRSRHSSPPEHSARSHDDLGRASRPRTDRARETRARASTRWQRDTRAELRLAHPRPRRPASGAKPRRQPSSPRRGLSTSSRPGGPPDSECRLGEPSMDRGERNRRRSEHPIDLLGALLLRIRQDVSRGHRLQPGARITALSRTGRGAALRSRRTSFRRTRRLYGYR